MKNNIGKLLRTKLLYEAYFNASLDDSEKNMKSKYVGKRVTWYGFPEQMVVLHKDDIYGMEGNIYDNDKLEFVSELIATNTDYENVEFECSYGIGGLISFTEILEEQESFIGGRFDSEYSGKKNPATTGDSDLDVYVGTEEIEYLDFMDDVSEVVIQFFDKYRFSLIYEKATINQLEDSFRKLKTDEYDVAAFKQFKKYEVALKEAETNDEGDFNRFMVQLRDAHHRIFGAIAADEEYVCLNLDKKSIEECSDYITRVTST